MPVQDIYIHNQSWTKRTEENGKEHIKEILEENSLEMNICFQIKMTKGPAHT